MIFRQRAKPAQVVSGNSSTGLRFDRDLHVAEHEVDFDATRQPPVGENALAVAQQTPVRTNSLEGLRPLGHCRDVVHRRVLLAARSLPLLPLLMMVAAAPSLAATVVYHSPNDDGLSGPMQIPEGGVQSVYLYIDGGAAASSGGSACNDGTGDEVCGFDLEVTGAAGLTLSSFTPDGGANLLVNFSGASMRVNGLDTQSPTPGPHRLGELQVNAVSGGAVDLLTGEVVGADLGSEVLSPTTLVTVPEPGQLLLLVSGGLLLGGLARRRAVR
jgi:hypothetical protein